MPRFALFRARRNPKFLAITTATATATLVAAMVMHVSGVGPTAAASPLRVPTVEETIAGLNSVAASYPGGLPALRNLFVTGECAGVHSYVSAPLECRALIDLIVERGTGGPTSAPPSSTGRSITSLPSTSTTATESSEPPTTTPPTTTDPTTTTTDPTTTTTPTTSTPSTTTTPTTTTTTDPTTTTADPTTTTTTSTTTTTTATTTPPTTIPPTTTPPMTTPPTTTPPTITPPTTTPPTTIPPTTTTTPTTTPTMPPPQPLPPLLVAVGDSITSGHEARPERQANGEVEFRTTCDDPKTTWAEDLRNLLGVAPARYFNFAHSGASTVNVLTSSPYTNGCGAVTQQARTQIADADAVLRANPSRAGAANVAVATAGINNTNWVSVAGDLVRRQIGLGGAPAWAIANAAACTDYVFGNRNGSPGAPGGLGRPVPPAWDGEARSGVITAGVAQIAIGLIAADPGAQVRHLLYYKWQNDPFMPPACVAVLHRSTDLLNGWVELGVAVAQIQWMTAGFDPSRIGVGCAQTWPLGPQNIQMVLISAGIPNGIQVSGWPHPSVAGRASLAVCMNRLLPRAQGGGVA